MVVRGLTAVLAAAVACGMVAVASLATPEDEETLQAVPAPVVTTHDELSVTRALPDLPVRTALPFNSSGLDSLDADSLPGFDPFTAVIPEVAQASSVEVVPVPTAPSTIRVEQLSKVSTAAPGRLLTRPVSGRRSSPFGLRFHPVLRVWKLHTGLDTAVSCGTPVGAAAPGVVVFTGWAGGNGVQIKVDHGMMQGHRVVTTYNHLSSIGVRVGQRIDTLDGIGRVGSTGYSTGCHLHLEVIVDGRCTDPEPWLNGDPSIVDLDDMVASVSPTPSPSPSESESPLPSPTGSPSPSPTGSPSPSPTGSPSESPSPSTSESPGDSPSPTPDPSGTPTDSESPTTEPTVTPTGSESPSVSASAGLLSPSAAQDSPTASPTDSPTSGN
ncbi:M23 family metallopeptidase [Tessaracoccus defluvii]|uniref:M23 family metallopeptidase n=1 Tax=Tessaracoccus defluvii TaxID=1285901 RepID=A0A7H0H4C5_9ACTN|nr:M23 family metallopeptidase [Tessaracoccus defluvii]QNP55391.1 M23 family metallopeptidase [Tessaracoccus defluvii]